MVVDGGVDSSGGGGGGGGATAVVVQEAQRALQRALACSVLAHVL